MTFKEPSSSSGYADRPGLMAAPAIPSSSSDRLLQDAFLSATQLPTPQTHSPANLDTYFPGVAGSPESPLAYTRARGIGTLQTASLVPRAQPRSASPTHEPARSPSRASQTVTPECSPASSSKRPSNPPIPTRRPFSAPLLSTKSSLLNIKAESPPPAALAPAHIISPPVSAYSKSRSPEASAVRSNVSSPFIDKLRLHEEASKGSLAGRSEQGPELLTPQPKPSLASAANLFSPVEIGERRPISTQSDGPTPPLLRASSGFLGMDNNGRPRGDVERMRTYDTVLLQSRQLELENRRPAFLKRFKRNPEDYQHSSFLEENSRGLGILTSPHKGRRIQLFDDFQQTSEESFEESLMTNGYGTYGEPRTPQRPGTSQDGRGVESLKWEDGTPAGPSSLTFLPEKDVKLDQKELKKRKRLEAFLGTMPRAPSKLCPAEVEGIGRVLVPPEDVDDLVSGTPVKKRSTGKKRKNATSSPGIIDKKGKGFVRRSLGLEEYEEPKWLDDEFPWSLRGKEREEERYALQAEKLKWIERYFSRDSDSDGSEQDPNDEEVLPSSTWGQEYEDPPIATRRGRGKAVPLHPDPEMRDSPSLRASSSLLATRRGKSMYLPSDPADARAALLSKRSVRIFAQRRQRRNSSWRESRGGGDDGQFACACGMNGHGDDGKPAVECSQCKFWYHFECIGIKDESELGDEDDTWFCSDACREAYGAPNAPEAESPSPQRSPRQPTFVPTDDRPPPSLARGDVTFYSSSPLRGWGSSSVLETPVHVHSRSRDKDLFRRSLWDDVNLQTPAGPSSPLPSARNVRVSTPGGRFDGFEVGHDEMGVGLSLSGFDPMATPSRMGSLKFAPGLFATPKQPSFSQIPGTANANGLSASGLPGPSWASRAGTMFATPTPRSRHAIPMPGSTGLSFGFSSAVEDGRTGGLPMYAPDDTPIRRAPASTREQPRALHVPLGNIGRRTPESPTAGRGPAPSFTRLQDSPVMRPVAAREDKTND